MAERCRPRVLHLTSTAFGPEGLVGGGERFTLELARHMADAVPTRLVVFGRRSRREAIGRLDVHMLGRPWHVRGDRFNPLSLSVLPHLAWADVIHVHQQRTLLSSFSALLGRATGRPVFVSDHGGGAWDFSGYMSTDRWYAGHLHDSQYSRELAGHGDKAWARTIYGGVDLNKFSPAPGVRRESILYVGRLLPHKGVNYLVDAVPPEMPLEIVGRPYHREFAAYLQERAAGKRVTFHFDFEDHQLVAAYRRAICIVLPSVYRDMYGGETRVPELLGQTLLEGMACGAPGICSDVASMPEIIRDGQNGFIVPPNDSEALRAKLTWLVEHPAEAARLGAEARRDIEERFNWPVVVSRCLDAYATIGGAS